MIIKEPENKTEFAKKIYFAKSARIGFSHILSQLFSNSEKKILMPAYIGETDKEGSGVFDPVRQNNVAYGFYRMKDDLSGDIQDIEEKIKSGVYRAILIIHYFGFVQNEMRRLSQLCKENNVVLIEDCAHSFFSKYEGKTIGEWGDVCFYSIHKVIPTEDGGYFQINNEDLNLTGLDINDQDINVETLDLYIRTDYLKVNQLKVENYKYYLKGFLGIEGIEPLFPELPDGIIPLNFPIKVDKGLREKLYFKLIDKGVLTCALYYRMIEEIAKDDYPNSYALSNCILNLPVHQDTLVEDIYEIISKLKESLIELNA